MAGSRDSVADTVPKHYVTSFLHKNIYLRG